jgi:hypothetical protein
MPRVSIVDWRQADVAAQMVVHVDERPRPPPPPPAQRRPQAAERRHRRDGRINPVTAGKTIENG